MDPIVLPALITIAVGLGLTVSRSASAAPKPADLKASNSGPAPPPPSPTPPAEARQPVDYNVSYSATYPDGKAVPAGRVYIGADLVPGHAKGDLFAASAWTGTLAWESPDKTYGAVTARVPSGAVPATNESGGQLNNGLLLARRT